MDWLDTLERVLVALTVLGVVPVVVAYGLAKLVEWLS